MVLAGVIFLSLWAGAVAKNSTAPPALRNVPRVQGAQNETAQSLKIEGLIQERRLQDPSAAFENGGNVFIIADTISVNLNEKSGLQKSADTLSPIITTSFNMFQRITNFIQAENPSADDAARFAIGLAQDLLPVVGLGLNVVLPGAGTLFQAVAGVVLSIFGGMFNEPDPLQQLAEQVATAIQDLREELLGVIAQVETSLTTLIIDRDANEMQRTSRSSLQTFFREVDRVLDATVATANSTLNGVFEDAYRIRTVGCHSSTSECTQLLTRYVGVTRVVYQISTYM